ncbi:hypothetical protein BA895_14840 [Humibacillus sp. DSM 29435]|uniref:DUF427 domain-containing protein n=1 Tax=Humibacillus sp. DSM 29435 TaxID=1869167 RepID=UPI000872E11C|nr:DUF427 domain-containing protein [Humibacillus sp. DSM 29435]OFE17752.1 hypothetical protein BA895_14840 [Humibacillus sp. DSM 29435]
MAIDLSAQGVTQRDELRFTPTSKRIRASRHGHLVCTTTEAVLVWLPGRVVPEYAVPAGSFSGDVPRSATPVDDPELGDYLVLPFRKFDWLEEDESVIGHPHDPYSRLDILHSNRHVTVTVEGVVLADSNRPVALFETGLPTRWYLPAHDVSTNLLVESETRTTCAYKGHASYLSLAAGGGDDIAWVYRAPLREAEPIRDLICFWPERTTTLVDGDPA